MWFRAPSPFFHKEKQHPAVNPAEKDLFFPKKRKLVVELACCQFKPRPQTGVQSLLFF